MDPLPARLERGGKGHLIPEAGAIAVMVPEGQMCSRCQKGPKGALIIFSLMTLLFISSTRRSACVRLNEGRAHPYSHVRCSYVSLL